MKDVTVMSMSAAAAGSNDTAVNYMYIALKLVLVAGYSCNNIFGHYLRISSYFPVCHK